MVSSCDMLCSVSSVAHVRNMLRVTVWMQGHALGVGACVVSSDGCVVLMRRSAHVGEGAGLWDVPGGHPEPSVRTSSVLYHFTSIIVTTRSIVSACRCISVLLILIAVFFSFAFLFQQLYAISFCKAMSLNIAYAL